MKIVAVVITYNEEIHIKRCLDSIKLVTDEVIVIDSFSDDKTVEIAKENGALVIQRKWLNHADQFQFGIDQVHSTADWIMRIDADEYLSDEYVKDINTKLASLDDSVSGVYCSLRRIFQGKMIRFGAVNIKMLRLWRNGRGKMETRWMDEHVRLDGKAVNFRGYIIDHNLNSLGWWTTKHNVYSSREVIDILNRKYGFDRGILQRSTVRSPFGIKRLLKDKIYYNLPSFLRTFLYFCYRFFYGLGFLDGSAGLTFHFLQGFWYRFLVDAKLAEVERAIRDDNLSVEDAIFKILDMKVN